MGRLARDLSPSGLVGRVLSPGGGVVEHFDRFIMPCIAQVEYRLGDASHLLNTAAMTPVTESETRVWAVIQLRLPMPSRLVAPIITPIATRILGQDAHLEAPRRRVGWRRGTGAVRASGDDARVTRPRQGSQPIDVSCWRRFVAIAMCPKSFGWSATAFGGSE